LDLYWCAVNLYNGSQINMVNEAVHNFQAIHDEYRPKILRYLNRLVGEFEAEDLTQEVLLKISQALKDFRGESKLSTWIYRIATNAALDKLRSPATRQMAESPHLGVIESQGLEFKILDFGNRSQPASIETQIFLKQRLDCYQEFIGHLPMNYRTVLALSEIEGLAPKEIAEILGLSYDVVKIRLHRARSRLLQEIKKECKAEDWL
jgi:RNA polymerase sigma-70 factor, ECF subfamily